MRNFLINLFRDDTFGSQMGIYNLTHILFLVVVAAFIVVMMLLFAKREDKTKTRVLDVLIGIIICLYFGDFFIHPLLNNENALIVDKLPFHLCTSASILICIARMTRKKCDSFYFAPVLLGMIGALSYILYPTGIAGHYLLSYRSLQTMAYHSLLFSFGFLSLAFGDLKLNVKKFYSVPIMVAVQIVISIVANHVYSTSEHHYDWYFSTGSTFGISEVVMPFIVFAFLNLLTLGVFGFYYLCRKKSKVKKE